MTDISKECEELTKQLVNIKSVNTTEGEREIAEFIEKYLRKIPYFQKNPENIIIQPLKNDKLVRRNVFAYVHGTKEESDDTLLFHGHMDTVGTEDYGILEKYACRPDELLKEMLKLDLKEEIRKDLESGDYMPGRGACDMKSGDAVFLVLLKYFSERTETFKGNILVSINPVEENLHTGIIEGLEVLIKLKEEKHFNYIMAVNNDYTCPLYEGDTKRYIYTGAVGKLLPCFYIQGKETHVGQCFEGFDASLAAAELVREINYNTKFCDGYNGEYSLPPSVLKMKDLKNEYNVQTAFDAFVYFNYFIHAKEMKEIISLLKESAENAVKNLLKSMNRNYKKFCRISKIKFKKISYKVDILTFDELYQKTLNKVNFDLKQEIEKYSEDLIKKNTDKREIPMYIVKKFIEYAGIKNPVIVLFFAAPYCPHNTLKSENEDEKKAIDRLYDLVSEFEKESGEKYEMLQFFPSLSDSSYLKIDDDKESINMLINNFPSYEKLYNVPLYKIKGLNINAVNYGVYGKDAHKWTERVYKPYSFKVLPKLIIKTVNKFLG